MVVVEQVTVCLVDMAVVMTGKVNVEVYTTVQ